MGYLLTEIVVYLVIAGLIGFAFGWAVRDGVLDKYSNKVIELVKKVWAAIKSLFTKVKSYFSNLKIFKKSDKVERDAKIDAQEGEKSSVIAKIKDSWKAYYLTLTTSKKTVKEASTETVAETVSEVTKDEIKEKIKIDEPIEEVKVEVEPKEESIVSTSEETNEPVLLSEAPEAGQDKLSSIKGIGPVLEKKLNELGVYSFEQIASWDEKQELWIGTQMAFPKRVAKEEWVKQAKELLNNK